MTETFQSQKNKSEKEIKIDQVKNYLDDLNHKLQQILSSSRLKMEDVVKKGEEEKIKKVLDDLRSM
ncbi:hypothetical protein JXK06_02425 [Patescibacteria group bacterium]|nr:hypothetical protein [Patescibacteria group bacterium]